MNKPIIGLCGGVGSGKTEVANCLRNLGCYIIDSDQIASNIMGQSRVIHLMQQWWGPLFTKAGQLNKFKISQIIFNDPKERKRLEEVIHPRVIKIQNRHIESAQNLTDIRAIVLDCPLLFENDLDKQCDFVVFVDADRSERMERVISIRNWSEEEFIKREKVQSPLKDKMEKSNFVINNSGKKNELKKQVEKILKQVLEKQNAQAVPLD